MIPRADEAPATLWELCQMGMDATDMELGHLVAALNLMWIDRREALFSGKRVA